MAGLDRLGGRRCGSAERPRRVMQAWLVAGLVGLLLGAVVPLAPGSVVGGPIAAAQDIGARIVVIVGGKTQASEFSLDVLRRIFLGNLTTMPNGKPFIPLNHSARTPVRVAFDKQVLGMGPDQVGRYWVDQRIRGRGTAPRDIPSMEMLRRVVAVLPGSVAYIPARELRPGVRPLKLDGVDFREGSYKLQLARLGVDAGPVFAEALGKLGPL